MKKLSLLFILMLIFIVSGCSNSDNNNVKHQASNLIITNYSTYEISTITISHSDKVVAVSTEPIKDTQLCYFNLEKNDEYEYNISFVDNNNEEHSQEFKDDFTGENPILIAIKYENEQWLIDYDN